MARTRDQQYGTPQEREFRTSTGARTSASRFVGRDYERENYGGGYDPDHLAREDRPRRRKGAWMRPGQIGGDGADGIASERAFGTEENAVPGKFEDAYLRWRERELSAHDRDYERWRAEQVRRYDARYHKWKKQRRPQGFGEAFEAWRRSNSTRRP